MTGVTPVQNKEMEFEEAKQLYKDKDKDLSHCFAMLHINLNKVSREFDQVKEEVTQVKKQ